MTLAAVVGRGYRWVVLALTWAAFTVTSLDRSTWGPAATAVGAHLRVSGAALGMFATAYYVGYVVSNAGGGVLTDRLGPRRVLAVSLFVAGGFMIMFGQARSAGMGVAAQALVGVFAGCDYAAGVSLLAGWFPASERGLAMGVYMTATSLGTVIANAVAPSLIAAAGWRAPYHLFGSVSMVIALLCLLGVRSPRSERQGPKAAAKRHHAGPSEDRDPASPATTTPARRLRWPSRDLVLLGAAGFGALWGTYGFVTWSNALMTKGSHVSARQAGVVVVIVGLAAVVSKPLVGLLTDRLGARRKGPTMAVLGMFAVTLVGFGACRSLTAFLWIAPVLGVVAYVYSPLMVAMIPELASTGRTGTAAGVTNACWQLGSAVVPVVVGGVFDATRSFFAAFATLAAGPLVGLMLMAAVREPAGMDQPERMEVGMT